jgi:hypothetical protein
VPVCSISISVHPLQAAGLHPSTAPGVGISVDHRRVNRSQESFNLNVQRLKEYKAKLIVFPRNGTKGKNGDSSAQDIKQAHQVNIDEVMPVKAVEHKIKARKITAAEKSSAVSATLRKARTDALRWGARLKLAAAKVLYLLHILSLLFFGIATRSVVHSPEICLLVMCRQCWCRAITLRASDR